MVVFRCDDFKEPNSALNRYFHHRKRSTGSHKTLSSSTGSASSEFSTSSTENKGDDDEDHGLGAGLFGLFDGAIAGLELDGSCDKCDHERQSSASYQYDGDGHYINRSDHRRPRRHRICSQPIYQSPIPTHIAAGIPMPVTQAQLQQPVMSTPMMAPIQAAWPTFTTSTVPTFQTPHYLQPTVNARPKHSHHHEYQPFEHIRGSKKKSDVWKNRPTVRKRRDMRVHYDHKNSAPSRTDSSNSSMDTDDESNSVSHRYRKPTMRSSPSSSSSEESGTDVKSFSTGVTRASTQKSRRPLKVKSKRKVCKHQKEKKKKNKSKRPNKHGNGQSDTKSCGSSSKKSSASFQLLPEFPQTDVDQVDWNDASDEKKGGDSNDWNTGGDWPVDQTTAFNNENSHDTTPYAEKAAGDSMSTGETPGTFDDSHSTKSLLSQTRNGKKKTPKNSDGTYKPHWDRHLRQSD